MVGHLHRVGRGLSLFKIVRHGYSNVLAVVTDGIVLERRPSFVDDDREILVRRYSEETANILPVKDCSYAGHLFGSRSIQGGDRPLRNRGQNRHGVEHAGKIVVRRISRGPANFQGAVDPGYRSSDDRKDLVILGLALSSWHNRSSENG